jgi:membrane fusion protein, multidrug efflux system
LRPVTRGQATVDKIEITSGLKVGEIVITEGADRLKDGAKVVLTGDKPAAVGGGKSGRSGKGGKGENRQSAPPAAAAETSPASASTGAGTAKAVAGPSAEQRQRMLDQVKDDPTALAQRKAFLEQIDKGDPAALARWQQKTERREGNKGDKGGQAGQATTQ